VAEHVKKELNLDFAFANTLKTNNGITTGEVFKPIVNAQRKADILLLIAQTVITIITLPIIFRKKFLENKSYPWEMEQMIY
jgi:hypothetical protein